ncbi:MAG: M56 family metallopeptidase [Bacteroidota bacterium]
MNNLIHHPITEALGWTLIHSLWQITLIALIYRLILWFPIFRKAQFRYVIGMALLTLALVFPLITYFRVYEPPLVVTLAQNSAELAIPLEPQGPTSGELLLLTDTQSNLGGQELSLTESLTRFLAQFEPFLSPLVLGWALGVLLMSVRWIGSWFYLREMRREGLLAVEDSWETRFQEWAQQMRIRRPVQLFYSQKVSEPLTLGHLRPLVLIPLGLLSQQSPQQIEALLLHELAHIRRYDYAWNILQSWIEILFFFHPAIWWLNQEIRESREHCCDDAAIAVSQDPLSYAQALTQLQLQLVKHPKTQLTMSASGNTPNFTQRIYRILGQPSQNLASSRGNLFAILAFIATFFLAFQQQQFQEEEAMLDNLLENAEVDTTTLQNWLLFTVRPETQQSTLDQWLSEVTMLSAHPFQLELETHSGGIQNLRAFKNINQEEQNMWELSHNEKDGLKKIMLVYDPILDMLYMQTNHSHNLFSYNLESDAFGYLAGEDLPFGKASETSLFPGISVDEKALDQLSPDKFIIEFTPQTTMDELLAWNLACAKLGMKLEYDRIGFDRESGELEQISGVYTNFEGKTLPFDYKHFSFVQFEVDRNAKTIPVALVATLDSTGSSSIPNENDNNPVKIFTIQGESSDEALRQIQQEMASYGIQLELDHVFRDATNRILALHGRFIYKDKTFRAFKIEGPKASEIHILSREKDPVKLYLGPDTYGSQVLAPKVLNTPIVAGTTHKFGRHLNVKKGPNIFDMYGVSNMWYMSSDEVFESDYASFIQNLSESTPLFLNDVPISAEAYLALNISVDSVEEFFYRDAIATKAELGETFTSPVYHVYTFRLGMNGPYQSPKKQPNFIPLESPVDSPYTPLIVLDGSIVSTPSVKKGEGEEDIQNYLNGLDLDLDQIESINVLKDGAAIQKYGEEGRYGVVEIKTKNSLDKKGGETPERGNRDGIFEEPGIRLRNNPSDSHQPLIVVDGYILPSQSLQPFQKGDGKESINSVLEPQDIESIKVLKGKAAKEKYGEKGVNGVIEIDTKLSGKIRLKIADFTLPNGAGRADPTMSQKRDDVLIIPKANWITTSLFINGKPYSKNQRLEAVKELRSQKILGIGTTEYNGKWSRYLYTDKAPEVLLNLALGQDPYKYSNAHLFLLNSSRPNDLTPRLEKIPSKIRGNSDFSYMLEIHSKTMDKPALSMVKGLAEKKPLTTRILNKQEALKEFGTTGATGLLVVEFEDKVSVPQESITLKEEVQADTLKGQGFQKPIISETPKNFPLTALGVSPNPSLGEITVAFFLEKKRSVRFSLYDLSGREIKVIGQKAYEKGAHEFSWNTSQLSAGTYNLVAEIEGEKMTVPLAIK